ncbi:MAG: flagellar motor protein MotD [Rhodospirillales bacterium 20-64-7]|nr:MAG: flagellar motor protein MotD [Rhodospirillales bacterium 20-64-7]
MQRPAPPKREKKAPNHERWVISYADLLTLLLALFVVLYASSTRNKLKMAEEAASLTKAFHGTPVALVNQNTAGRGIMPHQTSAAPTPKPTTTPPPKPTDAPKDESHLPKALSHQMEAEVLALQQVEKQLRAVLQPLTAKNQVSMKSEPLTLTIQLNDSVLFPSGQAVLLPEARALLNNVSESVAKLPAPFNIIIQGYTDDQPIDTAQFPSNWSLSAERAATVVELFADKSIDGNRLSAQGFAEFAPIASNTTPDGRAQNRRVAIVIHAPEPP